MQTLEFDFWDRHPTIVAKELIGCTLTRVLDRGPMLSGRIVETEAYHHCEAACHAYRFENRTKSDRVAHFFGPAGVTYVYLNYGIHKLLNVITGPGEEGSAVLIRAIEPVDGLKAMRRNRGNVADRDLCNGPGKLTQALGIDLSHNKLRLGTGCPIRFSSASSTTPFELQCGPRVGITKATELKWRFVLKDSSQISRAKENKLLGPLSQK